MKVEIITSVHSHVSKGMQGEAKWNRKMHGYEVTIYNLINPNNVGNNPQYTQTLFFEKHEIKPVKLTYAERIARHIERAKAAFIPSRPSGNLQQSPTIPLDRDSGKDGPMGKKA